MISSKRLEGGPLLFFLFLTILTCRRKMSNTTKNTTEWGHCLLWDLNSVTGWSTIISICSEYDRRPIRQWNLNETINSRGLCNCGFVEYSVKYQRASDRILLIKSGDATNPAIFFNSVSVTSKQNRFYSRKLLFLNK